jgi:membrane protease YdiL (CAAX protease family)
MVYQTTDSEVTKIRLSYIMAIIAVGVLTFAVPFTQLLVSKIAASSPYRGWISSIPVILCVYFWHRRIKANTFLPLTSSLKVLVSMGGIVLLGLLTINILNAPVSQITGQARTPFEVIDVILLVPLAEELIFRGVLWSIFERLPRSRWGIALAGTSLLFGVEHLGYWAQAGLPLPVDAFLHALSMVAAGLCFGALRWKSRSLAVPAMIHMLANGVILLAQ